MGSAGRVFDRVTLAGIVLWERSISSTALAPNRSRVDSCVRQWRSYHGKVGVTVARDRRADAYTASSPLNKSRTAVTNVRL